jgi:hypothetical protein
VRLINFLYFSVFILFSFLVNLVNNPPNAGINILLYAHFKINTAIARTIIPIMIPTIALIIFTIADF